MSPDDSDPIGKPKRSVLFVDDDPLMRRAVERVLAGSDVTVATADSADRALEILVSDEPPVVVSDYRMAGPDGLELLARVRRSWPDTVCLLVSAHADLQTVAQGINRVGLFRFLVKPCEPEDLREAILQALEHASLVHEKKALTLALGRANDELRAVNRRLDREVNRRTMDLLLALLSALDLKGVVSSEHFRRVALFASRLASELGLSPDGVKEVERGALLHDVGMLALPGGGRRGSAGQEAEALEEHSVYGYQILRDLRFLGRAREIVRHHHERWDGQGYPDGIAGEEIHIGARIVAVADAYDAMTSDRPDREAMSSAEARAEIERGRGTRFDPACVDAFVRIPDEDLEALRREVSMHSESALR